ncbi:MAG: metal ABC transporter permease [Candidatus Margulisiibacteriota bacterium]|nr:metal ABC transporter permease [Candidatus Margulisiibacteriota bacterium]
MLEILQYRFMQHAILASVLGGASCGVVGVWIIMMRIPFVGVAMSHAAFAGAIFGLLLGVNPILMALFFCLVSSGLIGPMAEKAEMDANISIGIIFSLMLGFAFLGMGLIPGPKTEALKFIWGNILLISRLDVYLLMAVTFIIFLFLLLFFKEIQAVLFHREIARAVGIPEKTIFYLLLFLTGAVVTLNLNTIGGLLIFSLVVNPPSAAYQLTYNLRRMFLLSAAFAITSCLIGLLFSYILNVPTGAVIIIASSAIFGLCLIFSPKRKAKKI